MRANLRNFSISLRSSYLITGLVLLAAMFAAAVLRHATGPNHLDRKIVHGVVHMRQVDITHVVNALTLVLSPELVALVVGVVCLAGIITGRYVQASVRGLVAAVLATILVVVMKHIANSPRPPAHLQTSHVSGLGFPSGHTTADIAIALTIVGTLAMPKLLRGVILLIAVLVALGRIYTGAHYMSDVAGGTLLAVSIALLALSVRVEPRSASDLHSI